MSLELLLQGSVQMMTLLAFPVLKVPWQLDLHVKIVLKLSAYRINKYFLSTFSPDAFFTSFQTSIHHLAFPAVLERFSVCVVRILIDAHRSTASNHFLKEISAYDL